MLRHFPHDLYTQINDLDLNIAGKVSNIKLFLISFQDEVSVEGVGRF